MLIVHHVRVSCLSHCFDKKKSVVVFVEPLACQACKPAQLAELRVVEKTLDPASSKKVEHAYQSREHAKLFHLCDSVQNNLVASKLFANWNGHLFCFFKSNETEGIFDHLLLNEKVYWTLLALGFACLDVVSLMLNL
jgi:hypothetical protein